MNTKVSADVSLLDRWQTWRREFERTCDRLVIDPASIRVVAVSKTRSPEEISAVLSLGVQDFGENRIQEAEPKIAVVTGRPIWHLVGHLQTNKAIKAARLFDWVQSVDSKRIAMALGKAAQAARRTVSVLVQVNTTGESQKAGCRPDELPEVIEAILGEANLSLSGVMTIGPLEQTEYATRQSFERAAQLREVWRRQLGAGKMDVLSMGMSGDWPWALEHGANCLRIGTAIFGERPA